MQFISLLKKRTGIAVLLSLLASLCGIAPAAHAAESWVGTGAPGEGGLVRGLYIVPNTSPTTLLAAVYGAGIFKSTDGGTSWAPSNTGLLNKRVRQVRGQPVSSGSPAWILAATEGGMYRSTDGGNTWSASNTGLQCLVVSNFDVFNSSTSSAYGDQNTVYAGTACATNSGVYKSIDGGLSWSKADWSSLSVTSAKVNSITVAGGSPNFGQIVWVSTDGQGLFRSADGGGSWARRNGTSTNILSGPNGSGNSTYANAIRQGTGFALVSVEGGGVYRSTDNGANWFAFNGGLPTNPTILNGPISNVSGQQYVAVAGIGFYQNSISGTSTAGWTFFAGPAQGLPAMVRGISTDPNTSTTWYATTIAGVYRSLNSGASWSPVMNGIGGGYAHSSTTDPNNPNVVLGAADAMYRSTDGGVTWVKSSAGLTDQPITPRFARGQANVALAGTTDSGVFKTVDGGVNWSPSNSGLPAAANLVGQNARMRTDPIVNGLHYVTLEGQGVYKSADYGATWTAINNGLSGQGLVAMTLGIDPVNSSNLYLTTAGGYYRSTDAGATWSLMAGLPTSGIEQGVVHVDPNNPAVAYAAVFIPDANAGAAANGGVWKTTNSGNTWTQVLNKLVHRVHVVGEFGYTNVYASAWDDVGGGVLKSVDGGATWTAVNTGLNSIYVRQFETSAGQGRLLRASAIGGGIMNFTNGVDAAVAGVTTALDNLKTIINTQGVALDYTHLLPGYDAGYLDNGYTATQDAQTFASDVRGVTINSATVTKVNSYDSVTGIIDVAVQLVTNMGTFVLDNTLNDNEGLVFKDQGGGVYKIYGNQQLARLQAKFETENRQTGQTCPSGCDGVYYFTQFQADAPAGAVAAVTVNGPGYPGSSLVFNGTQSESVQASPPPASPLNFSRDQFQLSPMQSPTLNFPAPGSQYTFTITPATGPQQQVTRTVTPWTTETISITNPTGHSLAAANLGGALTVNWTLPTTFTVSSIFMYVNTSSSAGTCNGALQIDNIAPNATSYTINPMPTQCLGQPIADGAQTYPVQVNVAVVGTKGEATRAWYSFGTAACTGNTAPGNLTATGITTSQVQLQWSPACMPTTIANYGVYRATAPGGPFALVGNTDLNTLTFNDTTASAGTTYYYYVQSTDTAANQLQSGTINVTTLGCPGPDCTAPSIPTNVVAVAAGSNQVNLTWTASADDVGVTRYQIGRNGVYINSNAPNTTTYSDFTALPGTTYDYFVSACDAAGNCSVGSSVSTVTTPVSSTIRFGSFGGPIAVQEGGTATFGAYLLKADNTTQLVNATWSGGSPGTLSPSGVMTVDPNAVSANTAATLTATFTDATLTGGQTLTTTREVYIENSQDHWVGNNQPGQGGDVRQVLAINDGAGGTTLVALVYGRGVWRSTNGGANWLPANFGIGERQVRSVTLLPDGTSNTLVLATESGVYRSVTRGGSWMSSNTGLTCTSGRVIGRKDATSVYLGTNGCGVFKSTNGGMGWFPVNNGLPASTSVVSISVSSTSEFVAIGTAGAGFYKSVDGGATWTAANNGLGVGPHGVRVTRILTDPAFYLASVEGSGVFRSSDGGANWSAVTGAPTGAAYGPFQRVGTDIYVGADGVGTFKSADNGVTWTQVTVTGMAQRRNGPVQDPNAAGTLYFATAAGVYKSVDSGSTWAKASSGLPGGFIHSSSTDPSDPNTVFATADTVHKSTDGGTTWSVSNSGITGHTAIAPASNNGTVNGGSLLRNAAGLFVSTTNHGVFRSTDNGASWVAANNGLPAAVGQGVLLRGDATNSSGLFATFQNYEYGAYRSANGGASWQSITGDLPAGNARLVRFIAADPNAPGTLYAATRAGLYKSVNDGVNWALLSGTTTCTPRRVRVDAGTNPSTVYWGSRCGGSQESGLYRSTNGGASWTQLRSFDDVFDVRTVRNGGALTLWVSSWSPIGALTTLGWTGKVVRSVDNGATFQSVTAGILPSRPRSFSLDSTGSQMLHLATGGAGLYTFMPAADTFAPTVPGSFTATPVSSSQINLAWTASTDTVGVTAYQVFRGATQVGTTNAATLAFNDTGLAASTLYNYGVRACDAAGNCSTQATASATTQAAADTTAPSVPTGLTATAVSTSQINLSWTASTDNVGVTAYTLYRGGVYRATVTGATSFSDTGLTNGTPYTYTVAACDTAGNCSAQSASVSATPGESSFTANLETGFNMIGNALNVTLDVPALFGNQDTPTALTSSIVSVWKWNATDGRWAFYSPQLTVSGIAAYAAPRNFEVLASIGPGEGYWVNATGSISLPAQTGAPFNWNGFNFATLPTGFNLISHATAVTPSQFNNNVSPVPPSPGVVPTGNFASLWVWDAVAGTWYFYSPLLESTGGQAAVKAYADSHFFRHFPDFGKTLDIGVGFWVNKP